MKRTIFTTIVIIGASVLFTGCGSYTGGALELNHNKKTCQITFNKFLKDTSACELAEKNDLVVVDGRGDSSMLTHVMYNKSTAAVLQVASEITIKKKDNFFAIAHPTLLSNFQGSLINTPQSYLEKCEINAGNVLTFNADPCNLHPRKKREATLAIVTYKEQPNDVLTFNAKEVLNYLKEKNLFDPNSSLKKHRIEFEVDEDGNTIYTRRDEE